ncbi:adrenodoxin-like protein 2, mitochondrial [Eurosta solidaginis]|uniref:adrenodoxin-like protein 2, mitochondrial n=1 Tax=Eurosta solidaginis TaxID=178769 RepID=UPI003531703A
MAYVQNIVRCSMKALTRNTTIVSTKNLSNISHRQRYGKINSPSEQLLRTFSVGTVLQEDVRVTFLRANGEKIQAKGKVGDTLLDVVVNSHIDLDGFGACEGTLTCSTCHLIFKAEDFEKLPDKASDEELDMLDLAYELTDTSRLGCQITLTKDMDGLEVKVPATINDVRSA